MLYSLKTILDILHYTLYTISIYMVGVLSCTFHLREIDSRQMVIIRIQKRNVVYVKKKVISSLLFWLWVWIDLYLLLSEGEPRRQNIQRRITMSNKCWIIHRKILFIMIVGSRRQQRLMTHAGRSLI
jgi:hypothetical protein